MSSLVLVRGLPGSGKSTFAQCLAATGFAHYEADMYFVRDGVYAYDPSQRAAAHEWCQKLAMRALAAGENVVVSNTFTQRWEMEPYRKFAEERGIPVHIVHMTGNFGSIHNVPDEAIERMKARWEPA
jgi:predicted kinase